MNPFARPAVFSLTHTVKAEPTDAGLLVSLMLEERVDYERTVSEAAKAGGETASEPGKKEDAAPPAEGADAPPSAKAKPGQPPAVDYQLARALDLLRGIALYRTRMVN